MLDNIEKMDVKQLRTAVQLLYDEVAIMKRKYEDILYNLDDDNFSSRFIKEKGAMKTAIEVNAEGIKTKVSNEDFQSTISQTADNISSIVSEFVDVSDAEEVSSPDDFKDINTVYVIDDTYYYYNALSKQWEEVKNSGMINSLFEQTSDGFKLKGNVRVDGSCVLTNSLTFDSSDNPLQVEYSVDGVNNWHTTFVSGSDKFMRLKIGARWSDAMKIVGSDGQNGSNGSDAKVTPENVFNALTDNGAQQGIFAAFVNKEDQIYINAEFIATNYLHLGDLSSNLEKKTIYFNDQANISTASTISGQDGLLINANGFAIACRPDYIRFIAPNGSSFTNDPITLAEYVAQYGSGGGTVVAVFG